MKTFEKGDKVKAEGYNSIWTFQYLIGSGYSLGNAYLTRDYEKGNFENHVIAIHPSRIDIVTN